MTDHDLLDMIIAQRTDSQVVSKLLGLSQLVVGSPRWAFGGCCTAVDVPLGI